MQFPAFRLTVAERMEAYRERLAQRISVELQRRGEDHRDLAAALRVDPRTAERWTTGERSPQRHNRKPIADYLGVEIEELWPDLELEEKRLRDQLNRIEANQAEILAGVDALAGALLSSRDADRDATLAEWQAHRQRRSEGTTPGSASQPEG